MTLICYLVLHSFPYLHLHPQDADIYVRIHIHVHIHVHMHMHVQRLNTHAGTYNDTHSTHIGPLYFILYTLYFYPRHLTPAPRAAPLAPKYIV